MSIHLHIVEGCFHATVSELGTVTEAAEPKIFTTWPSSEKAC